MNHRPDVQALRAFSICSLLGLHLVSWPSGGALGVDVFFVVSGFLITTLLMREFTRTGRISLRDFYARRARRILPAAVLVIVVTSALSIVVFGWAALPWLTEHGFASLFFFENWVLVGKGWDQTYLTDPYSPFQQYWSLSVEEQFYLVWPLLLISLLAVRRVAARRAVGAALLVTIVLSLGSAASSRDLYVSYHATNDRAWQLAAGALLAVLGWQPVVTANVRGLILGFAFAAIAGVLVTADGPGVYPGRPASVAVVGLTGMILVFGAGPTAGIGRLIAWRPVQYLGDLSYSLYLWNWPILVLLFEWTDRTRRSVLFAGVLILLVSVMSYHLVEQPIRRSNWLGRTRNDSRSDSIV
jgi:peptidoglycan/LPS O-acetylase OafA/YrhL